MKKTVILLGLLVSQLSYGEFSFLNWREFFRPYRPVVVPTPTSDLIKIEKADYKRNANASYCRRPVEMVDTIVIHHSESSVTDDAQRMNEMHLNRGTPDDPWLMVAYSYILNSPYVGGSTPASVVTEGRPLGIVGAHAGSNVFVPMSKKQMKLFDEGKITCGKEGEEFKVDPRLERNETIKANVTTIGIVVIGNYAEFSMDNPTGYQSGKPRYPSENTQDMLARTICQLQKQYPDMKSLKWHNFYHDTTCPGTLSKYIEQIKTKARNYGCKFN